MEIYNEYMLRILLNSLTRKPVKCRNRFNGEFKEHTTQAVRNWEMNLQIDAKECSVHGAIISCISKDANSFAFPWTRIVRLAISFLHFTE